MPSQQSGSKTEGRPLYSRPMNAKPPAKPALPLVTPDATLLATTVERRFLMATWEQWGSPLPVLSTVADQFKQAVFLSETLRQHSSPDRKTARGAKRPPLKDRHEIALKVGAGAMLWANGELSVRTTKPGALRLVRPTAPKIRRITALAAAIPDHCFAGRTADNHHHDRMAVATAILMRCECLAVNESTLLRWRAVNKWAKASANGSWNVIRPVDHAVQAILGQITPDPAQAALASVLLAALPENPGTADVTDAAVSAFIDELKDSSLRRAAFMAETFARTREGRSLANEHQRRPNLSAAARSERERAWALDPTEIPF